MQHIEVDGLSLEYQWIGPKEDGLPAIVLLHEGLGCAAMWRDWPGRIAEATGLGVLNYSRPGYGRSGGSLADRDMGYLDREAEVVLPAVLDALDLRRVILFGHSDGATIALLYAARPSVETAGMIIEAPHLFVEDVTREGIVEAGRIYRTTELRERLARYHGERVDEVFNAWHDVWLSDAFQDWNIENRVDGITTPILLIQGRDDQYGTALQLQAIEHRAAGPVETHLLPDCRHVPHRDRPETVLGLTRQFVESLIG